MLACQISAVVPHMISNMLNANGSCGGVRAQLYNMVYCGTVVHGYIKSVNIVLSRFQNQHHVYFTFPPMARMGPIPLPLYSVRNNPVQGKKAEDSQDSSIAQFEG